MSVVTSFPKRMARLVARWRPRYEEDPWWSRVEAALKEIDYALAKLEKRCPNKKEAVPRTVRLEARIRKNAIKASKAGKEAARAKAKSEEALSATYHMVCRPFVDRRNRGPNFDRNVARQCFESEAEANRNERLARAKERKYENEKNRYHQAVLEEPELDDY